VLLAVARGVLGLPVRSPYRLSDMADDAIGLLDALQVERAHVVGASMGGMIGQCMAARHPARLLSLTSIMSGSGNWRVACGRPAVLRQILRRPARPDDPASQVDHLMRLFGVIGSPRLFDRPGGTAPPTRARRWSRALPGWTVPAVAGDRRCR
jgi:pimeloyl-ACP methyl ester carboxylesterase